MDLNWETNWGGLENMEEDQKDGENRTLGKQDFVLVMNN